MMALAALCVLATGNVKAGILADDLNSEKAEQDIVTQEVNRASEALANHQSNWLALLKMAVRHQDALLVKAHLLIARARKSGYPQDQVDVAARSIAELEIKMNTLIAALAQQGISVR
jgi:hypothetical protein